MQEKKYFIIGLTQETKNKHLFNYFKYIEKVIDYIVIRNQNNISRKFGFITFETQNIEKLNNKLLKKNHKILGSTLKITEAKDNKEKKTKNFKEDIINEKIFVGGLPPSKDIRKNLINYFKKYGKIKKIYIKQIEKNNGFINRFAFIIFENIETVKNILKDYSIHKINKKWVEIKPYIEQKKIIYNHEIKFTNELKKSKSFEKNKMNLFKLFDNYKTFKTLKSFEENNKDSQNFFSNNFNKFGKFNTQIIQNKILKELLNF